MSDILDYGNAMQCGARTHAGGQCRRPVNGTVRCYQHRRRWLRWLLGVLS